MSNDAQLPGYSVDDDTHDDNNDAHIDNLATEPERADDPVLAASDRDAVASAVTVSSPTPLASTQSRLATRSQQEDGEEHPTAAAIPLSESPAVDEFTDPKISQLHAIFPDYDAALL